MCIKNFINSPNEKSEITDVDGAVNNLISVIFKEEKFVDKIFNRFR